MKSKNKSQFKKFTKAKKKSSRKNDYEIWKKKIEGEIEKKIKIKNYLKYDRLRNWMMMKLKKN